ncbi:NLPA lipoprotein [Fructilactobacillus fructivorans]|nr:NLPA lipoprotein [Fructilactobacillus fructivorans]KRN42588.1 NLPA lipoprotein [Fructilactobacillus fructivorans]
MFGKMGGMKMRRWVKYVIWIGIILFVGVAGYFSFFHQSEAEANTINVGIMAGSKQEQAIWNEVAKTAKDKYGLNVKFQTFTDYSQPNNALTNGDIDVNAYQNYPFLDNWNEVHHTDIVPVGDTVIEPMRIYSNQFKSVNDISNGTSIAVPNDTNNESRALHVLQSAGLIKLNPKKTFTTVKDITSNPKNLKIKEVDASQTPRLLNSTGASVVNGNFAESSNLSPKKVIYTPPFTKDSHKWVNFIASTKKNKNDKQIKELVKAYQTEKTAKLIKKESGINQQAAWNLKFK